MDAAEAEIVVAEAKDDITETLAQVFDYIHRETRLPWGAWDKAVIRHEGRTLLVSTDHGGVRELDPSFLAERRAEYRQWDEEARRAQLAMKELS